ERRRKAAPTMSEGDDRWRGRVPVDFGMWSVRLLSTAVDCGILRAVSSRERVGSKGAQCDCELAWLYGCVCWCCARWKRRAHSLRGRLLIFRGMNLESSFMRYN